MGLVVTLRERLKNAMKSKNEIERNIFRLTLSEVELVQNSSSQGGKDLTEDQILKIIRKVIGNNNETLQFPCNNQEVLREENRILSEFLPTLLSLDDIRSKLVGNEDIKSAKSDGQAVGIAIKFFKASNDSVDGNDVKIVVEEIRKNQ
jgi:uncharacterized protein YqeY